MKLEEMYKIQERSVVEVKKFISGLPIDLDESVFSELAYNVERDGRKGVLQAFTTFEKKRNAHFAEVARIKQMYEFQSAIAGKPGTSIILGMDEVGRGPLAGPLTVGGVVLDSDKTILGLNDSKQVSEKKREAISQQISSTALASVTFSVPPKYIDRLGMTECLRRAFTNIIKTVESKGIVPDVVLLDGNPLHIDPREVNVIKGDAKCASIAAASIIAKVERDAYMTRISNKYPAYNFASNKGYGTKEHTDAIKKHGLCPIHRKSFCSSFMQLSFF